ncbi:MAG: hypothetical protein AB8B82_04375 [Roseovarius sp.]
MDGNTLEIDPRTAEAMRQEQVYQNAMASLSRQARANEAIEDAVLAPAYGIATAMQTGGKFARVLDWSKLLLVAMGGGIVNYLFYVYAING